jgi:hypothetical protein
MDLVVPVEDTEVSQWTTEIETLLKLWNDDSFGRSKKHAMRSKECWRSHVSLTIPTMNLPIAMASIGQLYSVCNYYEAQILNSVAYLISGSLSGVPVFLNFGRLFEEHNQAEQKFLELHHEIRSVLVQTRENRTTPSLALAHARYRYERLIQVSPEVNRMWCCGKNSKVDEDE